MSDKKIDTQNSVAGTKSMAPGNRSIGTKSIGARSFIVGSQNLNGSTTSQIFQNNSPPQGMKNKINRRMSVLSF